jgi:DNA-directed RNA polymerase specialized sigma24 family protein
MPTLTEEQYQELSTICTAIARRYLEGAKPYGADLAELVQIALTGAHAPKGGAWKAHDTYNHKTKYSVWIGRAAHSAIRDWFRRQKRQIDRANDAGRDACYPGGPATENPEELKFFCPKHLRKWGTLLEYQAQHGLSQRALHRMLCDDLPLCRMLGFTRAPGLGSIFSAVRVCREGAWPQYQQKTPTTGAGAEG